MWQNGRLLAGKSDYTVHITLFNCGIYFMLYDGLTFLNYTDTKKKVFESCSKLGNTVPYMLSIHLKH